MIDLGEVGGVLIFLYNDTTSSTVIIITIFVLTFFDVWANFNQINQWNYKFKSNYQSIINSMHINSFSCNMKNKIGVTKNWIIQVTPLNWKLTSRILIVSLKSINFIKIGSDIKKSKHENCNYNYSWRCRVVVQKNQHASNLSQINHGLLLV
jgi:hypothetical protein